MDLRYESEKSAPYFDGKRGGGGGGDDCRKQKELRVNKTLHFW